MKAQERNPTSINKSQQEKSFSFPDTQEQFSRHITSIVQALPAPVGLERKHFQNMVVAQLRVGINYKRAWESAYSTLCYEHNFSQFNSVEQQQYRPMFMWEPGKSQDSPQDIQESVLSLVPQYFDIVCLK